MDPISSWFKTNAIIILGIICAIQFAFGGIGMLYLNMRLKVAKADLVTAQANYATCDAANKAWSAANATRNAAIAQNAELGAKMDAAADAIAAAAAKISGGVRATTAALTKFQSAGKTDCDRARDYIDQFYATKGARP